MSTKSAIVRPTSSDVRQALKQWHGESSVRSSLAALYLFRKLTSESDGHPRRPQNQLLLQAMEALKSTHARDVQFLQLRFLDRWPINHLANHFNVSEGTIYALQRQAIDRLTETLADLEYSATITQRAALVRRLEASTYVDLVGVADHLEHLLACLSEQQPPWVIAIEGLGGIGKTALADALLRQLILRGLYDEVGWVSARQNRLNLGGAINMVAQPALTSSALVEALARQLLPAVANAASQQPADLLVKLRARLKRTPHLIVIDNLETLVDLESLLPTLQDLANPSKFLLTSRHGLYTSPNIYHFKIPELSETHALQLIRQEAALSNLPVLAAAADQELRPIYATVGGNPLALRLVVGQSHIYTVASILQHLQAAHGETAENLYTYIYRYAWDHLDPISQDVLLVMPLVNPQGDDIEVIAAVGGLEMGVVRSALNRLVTLNLVDAHGGINDRRYSIHGLTRTFLHEQVLQWPQ